MVEKKAPLDTQNKQANNELKPPKKKSRLLIIILVSLLLLLLITGVAAAAVVSSYINDAPPLDPTYLETVETSYIFDSSGRAITPIHGEQHRIAVDLDEVPDHVEQAFIAIEDERFYEHSGFDLTANIRAAYTPNLVATFWMGYDEPRMGRIEQGWRYSTVFLREVFLKAFEDLEVEEFKEPGDIVRISVCGKSGLRPNDDCHEADTVISDYFIAGQATDEECDMHEDGYYNRPEYIETDERWSSKGGPGRGPEDAEEMPSEPGTGLSLFEREEVEGPVEVPNVTGSSQGMAEMRLARVGLEVGTVEQNYHDEVRTGRIIEQDPEPGTTLENGYEVDLVISRGPE